MIPIRHVPKMLNPREMCYGTLQTSMTNVSVSHPQLQFGGNFVFQKSWCAVTNLE